MRPLFALVAILAVVTALPTSPSRAERLKQILAQPYSPTRNAALENLILGVIEGLRETMVTGSDGIPVLDPLEIEHIFVDDQILPLPGAKVTMKDLTVTKLSTFEVKDLSVTRTNLLLQRYRVLFDGEIPIIDVDVGNYDLSVNALGLSIFGSGDAKIRVIRPRIQANLLVGPRISISGIFLNLLECDIKVNLEDFEPLITGMFNDPGVSDFVSLFLKNLAMEALDLYENDINVFLSKTIHEVASDILNDLDLASILG